MRIFQNVFLAVMALGVATAGSTPAPTPIWATPAPSPLVFESSAPTRKPTLGRRRLAGSAPPTPAPVLGTPAPSQPSAVTGAPTRFPTLARRRLDGSLPPTLSPTFPPVANREGVDGSSPPTRSPTFPPISAHQGLAGSFLPTLSPTRSPTENRSRRAGSIPPTLSPTFSPAVSRRRLSGATLSPALFALAEAGRRRLAGSIPPTVSPTFSPLAKAAGRRRLEESYAPTRKPVGTPAPTAVVAESYAPTRKPVGTPAPSVDAAGRRRLEESHAPTRKAVGTPAPTAGSRAPTWRPLEFPVPAPTRNPSRMWWRHPTPVPSSVKVLSQPRNVGPVAVSRPRNVGPVVVSRPLSTVRHSRGEEKDSSDDSSDSSSESSDDESLDVLTERDCSEGLEMQYRYYVAWCQKLQSEDACGRSYEARVEEITPDNWLREKYTGYRAAFLRPCKWFKPKLSADGEAGRSVCAADVGCVIEKNWLKMKDEMRALNATFNANNVDTVNGNSGLDSPPEPTSTNLLNPVTYTPTLLPTSLPTSIVRPPTYYPSASPFFRPSDAPTRAPTTVEPTAAPSRVPTHAPTELPTCAPTRAPTELPTRSPTSAPTYVPTEKPTAVPTPAPTYLPTDAPTTVQPTVAPTTLQPTGAPTGSPTLEPREVYGPYCGKLKFDRKKVVKTKVDAVDAKDCKMKCLECDGCDKLYSSWSFKSGSKAMCTCFGIGSEVKIKNSGEIFGTVAVKDWRDWYSCGSLKAAKETMVVATDKRWSPYWCRRGCDGFYGGGKGKYDFFSFKYDKKLAAGEVRPVSGALGECKCYSGKVKEKASQTYGFTNHAFKL